MHETITYEPDMYLTNKDVKDIQEIFQTPLIGTYNSIGLQAVIQ